MRSTFELCLEEPAGAPDPVNDGWIGMIFLCELVVLLQAGIGNGEIHPRANYKLSFNSIRPMKVACAVS